MTYKGLGICLMMLAAGEPLRAQPVAPDEVQEALAVLRQMGSSGLAVRILAQEDRIRPQHEVDAFADSLVAVAITYRTGGGESERRASLSAAQALLEASFPQRRLPFPRSLELLGKIYDANEDAGFRGGVLSLITHFPNRGPAIDFLARVATSPESIATAAIRHLAHDTGPPGRQRLRRLYEDDAVVHDVAREHLEGMAAAFGWQGR